MFAQKLPKEKRIVYEAGMNSQGIKLSKNYSATFVDCLQTYYAKKAQKYPRYSLRALAQTLSISPSHLSLIMNGKRGVSKEKAQEILEHIGASTRVENDVIEELQGDPCRKIEERFKQVNLKLFDVMNSWYYYGILGLIDTPDFKPNLRWISARLKLPHAIVQKAVRAMELIGVLKVDDEHWKQSLPSIKVDNTKPHRGAQKFQKTVLKKALESLENDPFETRDIRSCTMTIDPKLLPEASVKIAEFRRQLMTELEAKSREKGFEPKEVYSLSVQLIPLTQKLSKKDPK